MISLSRGRPPAASLQTSTAPGTRRIYEEETGLGQRTPPAVYIFDAEQKLVGYFDVSAPLDDSASSGDQDALVSMLRAAALPAGTNAAHTVGKVPESGRTFCTVRLHGAFSGCAVLLQPERRREAIRDASIRCRLSARESEVLDLLVRGTPRSEIASGLGIGEPTVQSHVRKIASKLGCTDRGDIVARALGI